MNAVLTLRNYTHDKTRNETEPKYGMTMKAIVTGGAGFIGSHIARRLIKDGHKVAIIDDLSAGKEENIPQEAMFIQKDLSQMAMSERLYRVFSDCDVIFHNAASKKNICLHNPRKDLLVNGGGTLRLLQLAKEYGIKKFVHASTGSVYGEAKATITERTPVNPCSYYGISKLAGENYVRYFSKYLNTTILRYFHVYGERQEDDPALGGVVAIFKRQIREGKQITIHGDGEQERVFTHVDDIVNANIAAWHNPKAKGQIYNCSSKRRTTINELIESLSPGYPNIVYSDTLEGDIRYFSVNSSKISDIGVRFRNYG